MCIEQNDVNDTSVRGKRVSVEIPPTSVSATDSTVSSQPKPAPVASKYNKSIFSKS